MKKIILLGILILIMGITPFFADGVCRRDYLNTYISDKCVNLFELPWLPLLYYTTNILGYVGEKNMMVLLIGPAIYLFLGIITITIGVRYEL